MKRVAILLLAASFLPTVLWAQDLSGDFRAEIRLDDEADRIHLEMRVDRNDNWGATFDEGELEGLSVNDRESDGQVSFRLEREAGRVEFTGEWTHRRRIAGEFEFFGQPEYVEAMRELGYRFLDEEEQLFATMFDISTTFVGGLKERGHRPSWNDLVAMRIHGASLAYIDEMAGLGFDDLEVDELLAFRIHGVTPEFVGEMREIGGRRISGDDLLAARIHGVTPEFVTDLEELGYRRIHLDDLVAMRIHGVTIEFIEAMADVGYPDIDVDELVSCRIHGVDAQYAERMHRRGYEDASIDDLIGMKIRGHRGD